MATSNPQPPVAASGLGEERFRAALAGSPTAVFHQDLELRVTWISNPTIGPALGFAEEEMIGKTDAELLGEENGARLAKVKRGVIEAGERRREEVELEVRGEKRYVDLTVAPLRDEEGAIVGVACATTEISEGRQAEHALTQRDAILGAVSRGFPQLLTDDALDDAIQDVLARLGQITRCSRTYVFENDLADEGRLSTSQCYEWTAPGISAEIDNPELQDVPLEQAVISPEALERGEAAQSLVGDLPEPHRASFERQGILAIADLPIFVADRLWGFLGLDDCETERVWAAAELDGAKVAANALGGAIQRQRDHEQLLESEARFRGAFGNSTVGIALGEPAGGGTVIMANRALCKMLGYSEQELVGMTLGELTHPDDRAAQADAHTSLESGEIDIYETEKRYLPKHGHSIWAQLHLSMVRDDDGSPLYAVGVVQDISERKRAQERLTYLAYHDELTKLPNRGMFGEQLDLALARARSHDHGLAVLYVGLDDFKLINDSLGHAAGDTALHEVAARLRRAVRPENLVARDYGDEFLVLVPELEPLDERAAAPWAKPPLVSKVGNGLRRALLEPLVIEGQEFGLDARVGFSVFPDDGKDAEALVQHASLALHDGKRAARGLSRYARKDSDPIDELTLRHRLHKAVEEREFVLHYQPIVTLEPAWEAALTGASSLAGHTQLVEALIRWEDPEQGLVPPGEFIPVAEKSGLMVPITTWVIEEVCRQMRVWDEQGLNLAISFNLSTPELRRPTIVHSILNRVLALGVEPRRLVVELTEAATMENPTQTQQQFREAHEGGLRTAIDDFGAGYSSLSRLLEIGPDLIKIDSSFTAKATAVPRSRIIVEGFIQIARKLAITPVLEGIETSEQWRFAVESGCTLGQGFQICRPLPADELGAKLVGATLGRD